MPEAAPSAPSQVAPPTRTLPARGEPSTIFGWPCRGDIQKPRLPCEISWFLLCDFQAKNKIPGTPVAAIVVAVET